MEKQLTVSVGISAYNEEFNIKKHLTSIIKQQERGFKIKEIIVISDGSTDSTVDKIREIKDPRIVLLSIKKRRGQNANYNHILKISKGEIVVLLEADTLLQSDSYLIELIKPFIFNNDMGLVYGSSYPVAATKANFFDRMLTFIESLKESMLNKLDYNSLYFCGSGKALSKNKFANFSYPLDVPEDTYIYLYAKLNKIKSSHITKAFVLYKSPTNFLDYCKKTVRYNKGKRQLSKYFPLKFLTVNYRQPKNWSKTFFLKGLIISPIYMSVYIFSNLLSKVFLIFSGRFTPLWKPSQSTKILM